MENRIKIVSRKDANVITHDGKFHADDIVAIGLLSIIKKVDVARTRDLREIPENALILDVGGRYDGKRYFDHHQGLEQKRNSGSSYASAGLIWKHFYSQILEKFNIISEEEKKIIYQKIDIIIEEVDKIDNGEIIKNSYNLTKMVDSFDVGNDINKDFLRAVEFVRTILKNQILKEIKKLKNNEIIESLIINNEKNFIETKVFLDGWQDSILNSCHEEAKKIQYVIYQETNGTYSIVCVPDKKNRFLQRKAMPKEWAGLSGEELEKATGLSGVIFCHLKRFFMAVDSLETAIKVIDKMNQFK